MKHFIALVLCCLALPHFAARGQSDPSPAPTPISLYDVVVYGESSGSVVAAIAAKRKGRSVICVNPAGFAGGMSSSGLGATDFLGYRNTFGGVASEFYDGVAEAYGRNFVRSFEPRVGKQVFEQMIAAAGVTVVYNEKLDRTSGKGVTMDGKRIRAITMLSGRTYHGKMFIDATYVGDLMAAAGVTFTVGREPESQYGEDLAGVRRGDPKPRVHYTQKDKDHFIKDVDPYIKPGDPASGLLPHVHKIEGLKNGQGDRKIQAYNYRVCLTTNPENRIPIEKPPGYREIDHELLLRNFDAGDTRLPALIEPLAGGQKVDWNNMHAVGSDYPGANWDYPEASYERRREIEKEHETYIRGFLWTMANNPRVPEAIRKRTAGYGLPKDEFADNGGWPWMIYIREARRMVGDCVMTQLDCEGKRKAPDPVALGSFGMDSHVVQHFVTERGFCISDGVIWRTPPRPYGISYRAIVPKKGECENLFSPICLSASHVAHGSIRMEPVFMALSQSAAIAAGLAIDKNVSVQEVPYPALRDKLEAAKQILRPEAWKKSAAPNSPLPKETAPATRPGSAISKPNIVLILADDYGIPGVGCYGGVYKTPNLDALAAGGVRFERCFSAPLCAPSRALCMFGRYAFRTGVLDNGCGAAAKPDKEVSIAKTLKQAGYATALAGKWSQLSFLETAEEGRAWGFDEFLRWDKSKGERYWQPALNKNGQAVSVTDASYGPDLFHEFVVDFIRRHRAEPFFVYYPTTLIHGPILRTPDSRGEGEGKAKGKAKGGGQLYADNIGYLDKLVGKLVAALDEMGLREKTLIVFTGDNGSVPVGTINGRPVDGRKSQMNEGGSRVPLIANWKGVTPAGRVLPDLVGFSDFYATFAELAGATLPQGVTLDSRSFAPQLRGEKGTPRDWLYVQLGAKWYARNDGWKLTEKGELFDLSDAPFVQEPVSADTPSPAAQAARRQLQTVLDQLNPAAGASKQRNKGDGNNPQKQQKKERRKAKKQAARQAGTTSDSNEKK